MTGNVSPDLGMDFVLVIPETPVAEHLSMKYLSVSRPYFTAKVAVGDPVFDAEVRVEGAEAFYVAVIDQDVRALVRSLAGSRVRSLECSRGRLTFGIPGAGPGGEMGAGRKDGEVSQHPVTSLIRALTGLKYILPAYIFPALDPPERLVAAAVSLARRLQYPEDGLPAALARRSAADTLPSARARAFEVLWSHFPHSSEAVVAARNLLEDPHPEVRLRAAMALGEEGFDACAAIAIEVPRPAPARGEESGTADIELIPAAAAERKTVDEEFVRAVADPKLKWDFADNPAVNLGRAVRALNHLAASFPAARVLPVLRTCLGRTEAPLHVAARELLVRLDGSAAGRVALATDAVAGGGQLALAADAVEAEGRLALSHEAEKGQA